MAPHRQRVWVRTLASRQRQLKLKLSDCNAVGSACAASNRCLLETQGRRADERAECRKDRRAEGGAVDRRKSRGITVPRMCWLATAASCECIRQSRVCPTEASCPRIDADAGCMGTPLATANVVEAWLWIRDTAFDRAIPAIKVEMSHGSSSRWPSRGRAASAPFVEVVQCEWPGSVTGRQDTDASLVSRISARTEFALFDSPARQPWALGRDLDIRPPCASR